MPREPSTPRIAVWRKVRRLGAAQLLDGLVALPLDNRNREQLEWLAGEIREAGGEATLWIGEMASRADERALALRMAGVIAAEYETLIVEAERVRQQPRGSGRRSLARLRRQLRRIRARDYFPPPEREHAQQVIDAVAEALEEVTR